MTTTYNPIPTTDTSTLSKVSTQIELEPVDLCEYEFAPGCDRCGSEATIIGQGCGDSAPVLLCDKCLERGLEVIRLQCADMATRQQPRDDLRRVLPADPHPRHPSRS